MNSTENEFEMKPIVKTIDAIKFVEMMNFFSLYVTTVDFMTEPEKRFILKQIYGDIGDGIECLNKLYGVIETYKEINDFIDKINEEKEMFQLPIIFLHPPKE